MTQGAPSLNARKLTLERGGKTVLDAVSLELSPGQLTAICGPNGAGKSTLLSAMAGLLPVPRGGVFLDGEVLALLPDRYRALAIGYLPQNGEIAWDVSVERLVALGRLPHGDEGGEQARHFISRALELCDLASFASRPVSTLSGGERARALLARVLAGDPRWMLADEPFAALDLAHQLSLLGTLRVAAGQGCGIAVVVHDLALAMNHADRVLVLGEGKVMADGPPEEALSAENVAEVWRVNARWLGEPGQRALVVD